MIVEKIEQYLLSKEKTLNEELLELSWEAYKYAVKRQLMEDREVKPSLTGSSPGPCARKMAYKFLGFQPSDDWEPRTLNTFLQGDLIELTLVILIRLAGIKVSHTCLDGQTEGWFDCGNGVLVPCHPDGILEVQDGIDEQVLLEIKSSSDFGFKREWTRGNISDQYYLQHQTYMEAFGLNRGVFLVQNKNTGHIHEIETVKDPDAVEWAKNNYISAANADENNLPPRFEDGKNYGRIITKDGRTRLAWGCTYCDFKAHCWPEAQVEFDRGKPIYIIPGEGETPSSFEIDWDFE